MYPGEKECIVSPEAFAMNLFCRELRGIELTMFHRQSRKNPKIGKLRLRYMLFYGLAEAGRRRKALADEARIVK